MEKIIKRDEKKLQCFITDEGKEICYDENTALKYVWKPNKPHQKIGNKDLIIPVTIEIFEKEDLPRTLKGWYKGDTIEDQYQDFLEKYSGQYARYFSVNDGPFKLTDLTDLKKISENIYYGLEQGWVLKVEDFESNIAKYWRGK